MCSLQQGACFSRGLDWGISEVCSNPSDSVSCGTRGDNLFLTVPLTSGCKANYYIVVQLCASAFFARDWNCNGGSGLRRVLLTLFVMLDTSFHTSVLLTGHFAQGICELPGQEQVTCYDSEFLVFYFLGFFFPL